ncbi:MAG: hypothetical protein LBC83_02210 [Oscillospiraceae bacterium]|jgi:phosphopantetheinyl transferase|nr:hypothetical protein [Oscillospiraceae bacterium]
MCEPSACAAADAGCARIYWRYLPAAASHGEQHRAGRLLLCDALRCAEGEVLLRPNGKPYVPGKPEFSLSHTRGLVMLALRVNGGAIGCDVERLDRRIWNPEAILRKLSPAPEERALSLLQLWVCREAAYKSGLEHPLIRFLAAPEGYVAAAAFER